jgi:hypothetical protein
MKVIKKLLNEGKQGKVMYLWLLVYSRNIVGQHLSNCADYVSFLVKIDRLQQFGI